MLQPKDLVGLRIAVSAGPTRESLDPVRFLTNHSTGTMGFSLASAFASRGAKVTLIAGPTTLRVPNGVARRDVISAQEMSRAVKTAWSDIDVLVMVAAVADYRPQVVSNSKLKISISWISKVYFKMKT